MTRAFLAATIAFVAACDTGAARSRPAFVQGVVGSEPTLSVSGVAFRTSGATLRRFDDGASVALTTEEQARTFLPEGAVVAVRGEISGDGGTGRADEIMYRSALRGPLQGRAPSLLAVAGADVDVDAATVLLDASGARTTLEGLPAGGRVEVSGWPAAGNRVRATLVRALPGTPSVLVHGWSLAAPEAGSFPLSLVPRGVPLFAVDASGETAPTVPPDALVRVSGELITGGAPFRLSPAGPVVVEAQLLPRRDERAVVEGVVTAIASAELVLGEHRVRTTASTVVDGMPRGGIPSAALVPGVRAVAEGLLEGELLVAERLRVVGLVRLSGRIAPGSFAIGNPATFANWTVDGSTVVADDARTRIFGQAGEPLTLRQLLDLHSRELLGLPVAVHGYGRADGTIQAQRVDVSAAPP